MADKVFIVYRLWKNKLGAIMSVPMMSFPDQDAAKQYVQETDQALAHVMQAHVVLPGADGTAESVGTVAQFLKDLGFLPAGYSVNAMEPQGMVRCQPTPKIIVPGRTN